MLVSWFRNIGIPYIGILNWILNLEFWRYTHLVHVMECWRLLFGLDVAETSVVCDGMPSCSRCIIVAECSRSSTDRFGVIGFHHAPDRPRCMFYIVGVKRWHTRADVWWDKTYGISLSFVGMLWWRYCALRIKLGLVTVAESIKTDFFISRPCRSWPSAGPKLGIPW